MLRLTSLEDLYMLSGLSFVQCRTGGWSVTLKEISSLMALLDLGEAGISALEGTTVSYIGYFRDALMHNLLTFNSCCIIELS